VVANAIADAEDPPKQPALHPPRLDL